VKVDEKTLTQWYELMQERFKGVPREALRYYNIETLPRLMHALSTMEGECTHCASRLRDLDRMTENAGAWMKSDAPELKGFQTELRHTLKHLSVTHGLYAKGLWLSRYVLGGVLIGAIVALLGYSMYRNNELSGLMMSGVAIGMIGGWIAGKLKERSLRRKHKLF
jgi:hypothetical protein